MWLDQFLVALDVDSGAKVWEGPIDTVDGEAVIFLAHGQDRLVLVSSGGPPTGKKNQYGEVLKQHYVYAYDPSNGDAQWETSFEWTRPRKAEHMSRPVIVGETLFHQAARTESDNRGALAAADAGSRRLWDVLRGGPRAFHASREHHHVERGE